MAKDLHVKAKLGATVYGTKVHSVNGKAGHVVLTPEDIGAATAEGAKDFIVHVTRESNAAPVFDKTYAEVKEAYESGKIPVAVRDTGKVYRLQKMIDTQCIFAEVLYIGGLPFFEGFILGSSDTTSYFAYDLETKESVERALSLKADKTEIPKKVSQLQNDAGYLSKQYWLVTATNDKADKTSTEILEAYQSGLMPILSVNGQLYMLLDGKYADSRHHISFGRAVGVNIVWYNIDTEGNVTSGSTTLTTTSETSGRYNTLVEMINGKADKTAAGRVTAIEETPPISPETFEVAGIPTYISDPSAYPAYSLTDPGWYAFASIRPKDGTTVDASQITVSGAAGYTVEADCIYAAIKFDVAAMSQPVTISWGTYTETIIFRATDLAVRNLDYRVTFYVYDADPFATWEYTPATDTTFVAGKKYFTLEDGEYVPAEVTAGEAVTEGYYVHSKVIISGLTRNVTYRLNEIVDCPMEFILPEIEDEVHGAWYEIRCRHDGAYSMTLTPPAGVKIATEHTQKETAGINMINLHYTVIDGVKIWRFMNTHSTIPTS